MQPNDLLQPNRPDRSPARHAPSAVCPEFAVLDEVPGDAGLLLWLVLRDSQHWVHTPPSRRAALFAPGAAGHRLAQLASVALPAELEGPVTALSLLLVHPAAVDPRTVSTACFRLAAAMEGRGAPNAALLFARAAALAEPERAWSALRVGHMPRRFGGEQPAERWLACAAAVARRVEEWTTFGDARDELGELLATDGHPAGSRA